MELIKNKSTAVPEISRITYSFKYLEIFFSHIEKNKRKIITLKYKARQSEGLSEIGEG